MSTPPLNANDQSAAQPEQPTPPPAAGYAQPVPAAANPAGTITVNYWLSVFFTWIPALILYFTEKNKGDQRATAFHAANLNFSLIRTGVSILMSILFFIPILGLFFGSILGLAQLVLFILHIIAAVNAAAAYRNGGKTDPFLFNMQLVK